MTSTGTSDAAPARVASEVGAGEGARTTPYALVHVVAGETTKDLILPQVVAHMVQQAETVGALRPVRVIILFLEPARVSLRRAVRARVREIRTDAPSVQVLLLPYVSRFAMRHNAAVLGRLLRWRVGRLPVVFHCRGESAAEWAIHLRSQFLRAGIVADIRGAWPEELLFERGIDTPADASGSARDEYERALSRLRAVLAVSGSVLSVSPDMLTWLRAVGATDEKLAYVPCCIANIAFSESRRTDVRGALGLEGKLVFVYLGTITRYQHIGDGLVPFFRSLAAQSDKAHLLCLTNDERTMSEMLIGGGVASDRATILHAAHSEVTSYLCAGDAGLLLRAPSRMNRYSRPTKLGEYLGAGLPVILARGMGHTDALVERAGAGLLVDVFGRDEAALADEASRTIRSLMGDGEGMRARALQLAAREFVWSRYVDEVRRAYVRSLNA